MDTKSTAKARDAFGPIQSGSEHPMILAGDIGGTKTLLGLFDPDTARPTPVLVQRYSTADFPDLTSMVTRLAAHPSQPPLAIRAACFGVAGPIFGERARLTNVAFDVDARAVAQRFSIPRVTLLNDLQALASAIPVLEARELHALQVGVPQPGGTAAVVAAGTGFGQAVLRARDSNAAGSARDGGERFLPLASEGGHADFAARTERDITVLRDLIARYGRAEVEHVVSGPGLVNLHRVLHRGPCRAAGAHPHAKPAEMDAATITTSAQARRCQGCIDTLTVFVEAFGAETGNVAVRTLSTGGMFIGGGIPPQILPSLSDGRFLRALVDKGPMHEWLVRMPVNVILNYEAGLLGAAVYAAGMGL